MNNLTEALTEAYSVLGTTVPIIDTLSITHPSFDPIYLVRDIRPLVARLEDETEVTYQPLPFNVKLPDKGGKGSQSLVITLDNVKGLLWDFIDKAKPPTVSKVPVSITYRPYLLSDLSKPQMIPPIELYLKNILVKSHIVEATATYIDIVNRSFPNELYTKARFPGIGE